MISKHQKTKNTTQLNNFFSINRSQTFILRVGIILILLMQYGLVQSQETVVVWSENWDNATSTQPWTYSSFGWWNSNVTLVSEPNHGKVLKIFHPAGSVGSQSGIGSYMIPLDSSYKELYLSWDYYVPIDFDYGYQDGFGGGKFFGGFCGGLKITPGLVPISPNEGWNVKINWGEGTLATYDYIKGGQYDPNGYPLGDQVAQIIKGSWHNLTIRLKMNDGDQSNGLLEVFQDDVLKYSDNNIEITNAAHANELIEQIYLNSFFGGGTVAYASPKDEYMEFDNLIAFYYPKGSSQYRSGPSEKGRVIDVPTATSYHPLPPNRFIPGTYTDKSGQIQSHCGLYQPVNHPNGFQTDVIQIPNASYININVTKFTYDGGSSYEGFKQILKIYEGVGNTKVLKKTFEYGVYTSTPTLVNISGNSATIEWQSGAGFQNGFSLDYDSDGSGSGKNYVCSNYFAKQYDQSQTPLINAPSNLSVASTTSNSVNLTWVDNSTKETSFELQRMNQSGGVEKTINLGANVTKYTDAGLNASTIYKYRIRTIFGQIYSEFSNEVSVTTGEKAPAAPGNLTVVGSTSSSVSLSWSDNSNNETGFEVQRLNSSGTLLKSINRGPNSKTFTDLDLQPSTTYKYRILAFNDIGNSGYSNTVTTTTPAIVTIPSAPSDLKSVGATSNSVSLSWADNSDNETGFEVQRLNSSGTLLKSVIRGANSKTYTDLNLQPSTTYKYRIRAVNSAGNSPFSNTITSTTLVLVTAPSSPTGLKANTVTSNSVTMSWTDNSDNESGFKVERLDNSGALLQVINLNANTTSYVDKNLSENSSYQYRVQAYNSDGSSGYSNTILITTNSNLLPAPANFAQSCVSWNRLCFSWTDNTNDETGYMINRYDSSGINLLASFTLPQNTQNFVDTLLTPDTYYSYSLMSYNSQVTGNVVWIKGVKTDKLNLSSPSNLHALYLSYDSIGFSWLNPSGAESILVYKKINSGDFFLLDSLTQGQSKYIDKSISKGNIYNYELIAEGYGFRSAPSNVLSVNTNEYSIKAPENLYATNIKAKSLTINWSDVSLNESGYKLIRKSVSTGESTTIKLPANSTSYEDRLLTPEQQYDYTILAYIQNPYDERGSTLQVQTLSLSEEQRDFNNLVAYYNFQNIQNNEIPDLSGYQQPLNLKIDEPVNSVKSEKGAISIIYPAHVRSLTSASKIVNACKKTNELSIELWVNSYDNNFMPSTIISLANDSSDVGFEVQQDVQNTQESPFYKVLIQTKSTYSNGLPAISQTVPHRGNTFNHFVFTHNQNGDNLMYVNGELVGQGYRVPSLNTWKDDFYLTLADNGNDQQPFIGAIYLCAIYNKALTHDEIMNNYLAGPYDGIVKSSPSLKAIISPNPVINRMTLEIEKTDKSIYFDNLFYKISDEYGRILLTEKLPYIESNKLSQEIDLSSLEPGVYFLFIINSSKILQTQKIIKLPGN